MRILIKSFLLLVSTLLLGVFFSGCGAASTAIEKRNLEIQTKMSDSVFLEPVSPEKQIVYVKIRNTTDKDIDIEEQVKSSISAKGFKVTNNPDEAYFMIQANVLQVGRTDETGSDSALQSGFGGGLLGAGVSAATGGSGNNIGVGAAIGAVAGLLANTMVKDIYYSMVTDVEIRQRPAINEKISQYEDNYSEQGTTSTISQNVNTNSVQWKIYRTRVVSTANQVNLEFEDAKNELQKGLAKSLSGLL
ncbi:MAG: complement resistance protein TraT [Arcobacter sp.]|uniref:complement resistance protein TraT n=1 Tax=Arcobacter sp. TaxID=1872629 RepID=UPI002A74E5FA|nr:complement resistance protein TraT [Arcobacter sp.]MDY3203532.1 complement resistance protein TraT [Arcobacter sp.]